MESTKIFIDIDDEITFVAERVLSSKTQQVILVMPERAASLASLASLHLLYHVVGKSGKHVVLVTMDDVGRTLAQKAGFVTRNRVGDVELDVWDSFKENENVPKPEPLVLDSEKEEHIVSEEPEVTEQTEYRDELPNSSEKPDEMPVQEEKELSLEEAKQLNPSVFEIDTIMHKPKTIPTQTTPMQPEQTKPKYVESVKIVKLDGFELVVGGDAAVIKKSRELERKIIADKAHTISSMHDDAVDYGIIGSDLEAHIPKKKIN